METSSGALGSPGGTAATPRSVGLHLSRLAGTSLSLPFYINYFSRKTKTKISIATLRDGPLTLSPPFPLGEGQNWTGIIEGPMFKWKTF